MIENLDYEIEGTNIAIRVLMSRLSELEDKREKELKRIKQEST